MFPVRSNMIPRLSAFRRDCALCGRLERSGSQSPRFILGRRNFRIHYIDVIFAIFGHDGGCYIWKKYYDNYCVDRDAIVLEVIKNIRMTLHGRSCEKMLFDR